ASAACGGADLFRPALPHRDGPQAFVEENHQALATVVGLDPLALYLHGAALEFDASQCGGDDCFHVEMVSLSCRSLKRCILPVAVLGSSSRKWMLRGYLNGANCCFTYCCSARSSAVSASTPSRST